jgi:hypothetical protein
MNNGKTFFLASLAFLVSDGKIARSRGARKYMQAKDSKNERGEEGGGGKFAGFVILARMGSELVISFPFFFTSSSRPEILDI